MSLLHSYTEFSPSGNGPHILFRANNYQYDTRRYYIMNHKIHLEVYVSGTTKKCVTLTGNQCEKYEFGDRTKELQILPERFMRRSEMDAVNAINAVNSDLSKDELLNIAKSSRNGADRCAWFDIMAGRYSNKVNIDVWLKGCSFWRSMAISDRSFLSIKARDVRRIFASCSTPQRDKRGIYCIYCIYCTNFRWNFDACS